MGRARRSIAGIIVTAVVLAAAVPLLLAAVPAGADTLTLLPESDSTTPGDINLTNSAATQINNYSYVDETTSDGDTTYVYAGAVQKTDLYNLADSTVALGKITSVDITIDGKSTSGGSFAYTYIRTNSQTYTGATDAATSSTVYNTATTTYTTNPQTTAAWTWSEVNNLQVGASLKKARCSMVYVTVTYTPATAESYKEVGHTTVWGTEANPYDGNNKTVYIGGSNFTASHSYRVAYYDASASNNLKATENIISGADNTISGSYLLSTDPLAAAGTWHAVVFDTEIGTPPSTYAAGATGSVYDDTFIVLSSAIPEFPTAAAAIGVSAVCFGIYWWMRRRVHGVCGV